MYKKSTLCQKEEKPLTAQMIRMYLVSRAALKTFVTWIVVSIEYMLTVALREAPQQCQWRSVAHNVDLQPTPDDKQQYKT